MESVNQMLKNRVNNLPKEKRTFINLIHEAKALDDTIGPSLCNAINAKDVAFKGNKADIQAYAEHLNNSLKQSVQMTILFRTLLGKLLQGLLKVDVAAVKEGNMPITPSIFEGKVELE